jgi:hypothetical protein
MENLFFNPIFHSIAQTLINLLIFIAITGLLLYILFFILSKIMYRKSLHRREITLRLTFLWSLIAFLIVLNFYLFFLYYHLGIENMLFTSWKFYIGILSQIIIYSTIIILFFIQRNSLKKIINENSLT